MRWLACLVLVGWALSAGAAEHPGPRSGAGSPAAAGPPPRVRIVLRHRDADSVTDQEGLHYIAGGIITVEQPRPDMVVIRMAGLTAAGGVPCGDSLAALRFELVQQLELLASPDVANIELSLEGQLIGLLRCQREGAGVAAVLPAHAELDGGAVSIDLEEKSLAAPGTLFINQKAGPRPMIVAPGTAHTLTAHFAIQSSHPRRCFHKNVATTAFGPPGPRPPGWLDLLDPYRALPRIRDMGFEVVIRAQPANGLLPPAPPSPRTARLPVPPESLPPAPVPIP